MHGIGFYKPVDGLRACGCPRSKWRASLVEVARELQTEHYPREPEVDALSVEPELAITLDGSSIVLKVGEIKFPAPLGTSFTPTYSKLD